MTELYLTAKGTDVDKIMGLTIGADNHITKPFNPLEVAARVKTQLRENYFSISPAKSEQLADMR